MARWLFITVSVVIMAGCSTRPDRGGVMSKALPITVDDIADIRDGEERHEQVFEEYWKYDSPKLNTYLNAITESLAKVSTRPNLPYQVILLDHDEINAFGGPGGYIYITRGMINFVESESEIAAIIAHEIAHIAQREYSGIPPTIGKLTKTYDLMMKGTELAKDAVGSYGSAANFALKGVRKAKPMLEQRFSKDQEIEADVVAVQFMIKAGYDPNGMKIINDKLAHVDLEDVASFVNFMHTHPPFPERRRRIDEAVEETKYETGDIEVKRDMLNEVRQAIVNAPPAAIEDSPTYSAEGEAAITEEDYRNSFRFEPTLGVHPGSPTQMSEVSGGSSSRSMTHRKRYSWF